nr:hypothetical protein [uncultured Lachnoclostridium sp.]
MSVEKSNLIRCENENTKNIINEIYRINPNVKFNIIGEYITEKEALLLYQSVLRNSNNKNSNMVYIPVFHM